MHPLVKRWQRQSVKMDEQRAKEQHACKIGKSVCLNCRRVIDTDGVCVRCQQEIFGDDE